MAIFGRFPSFTQLYQNAGATFARFPFTLLSAIVASITAIAWNETSSLADDFAGNRLLITAILGVPLFTALTTFAERQKWTDPTKRLFPAIGVILLAAYYFTLPIDIDDPRSILIRWVLLGIGLHFLVAFLPFLGKGQQVGFWQYNKTLFLRFLLAALYSAVVYVGLAIALLAGDKLFGINVDESIYLDLWILAAGIFNTWVFLSWIPNDLDALNELDAYPGGLKVFTQFILLPLVALYFLILISYEAKILVTWNWPRGWVSNLVLWYSVVGILSLLLLHPLQKIAANRWIAAFGRWYFRGSIPLVVLLFFAILERVGEYGVTVNRYLVIAMAVGLSIVVLYMVFSRVKDIRLIPIVLFVLAFLSAAGPWSAFAVSETSQRGRLEEFLTIHGALANGKMKAAPETISAQDRIEMSNIMRYLDDWHGVGAFTGWIDDSTLMAWNEIETYNTLIDSVAKRIGMDLLSPWETPQAHGRFAFNTDRYNAGPIEVSDFDYLYDLNYHAALDSVFVYPFGEESCFVRLVADSAVIIASVGVTSENIADAVRLDLKPRFLVLQEKSPRRISDPTELDFDAESDSLVVRLMIENTAGKADSARFEIESMRARLLVGKRN